MASPKRSHPFDEHEEGLHKRRRLNESVPFRKAQNLLHTIGMREMQPSVSTKFLQSGLFGRMTHLDMYDTYDPTSDVLKLSFLKRRSEIEDIICYANLVIALAKNGVCAVFEAATGKRLCYLNSAADEVVRSVFCNIANNSIVTSSVFREDRFSSLRCRSIPISYIREGRPEEGFKLFEGETLVWPGFVEFDEVNGIVLSSCSATHAYKVWDLANYSLLYEFNDPGVQELKMTPGTMLLMYHRTPSFVPLKIISARDGSVLKSFKYMIHRGKRIEFCELFEDMLLVKQEGGNMQIVNVKTLGVREVPQSRFPRPSGFIFLHEHRAFITFRGRAVYVWDQNGELITTFEDHSLYHTNMSQRFMRFSNRHHCFISFCRDNDNDRGSIHISDVLTGKLIAKVAAPTERARHSLFHEDGSSASGTSAAVDLSVLNNNDINAVVFDELRQQIITGHQDGRLHVWGCT